MGPRPRLRLPLGSEGSLTKVAEVVVEVETKVETEVEAGVEAEVKVDVGSKDEHDAGTP